MIRRASKIRNRKLFEAPNIPLYNKVTDKDAGSTVKDHAFRLSDSCGMLHFRIPGGGEVIPNSDISKTISPELEAAFTVLEQPMKWLGRSKAGLSYMDFFSGRIFMM